jgi:hypothetical protein
VRRLESADLLRKSRGRLEKTVKTGSEYRKLG